MNDIVERLEPAAVMAHPLILQEARETILRLRDENRRVLSWSQVLEDMVRADAIAERTL